MEMAVKSLILGLNPEITSRSLELFPRVPNSHRMQLSGFRRKISQENFRSSSQRNFYTVHAVSSGLKNQDSSVSHFKEYSIAAYICDDTELKIRVDVSGAKTQATFDDVFSKLVAAAQPIPGFRRLKGGKTPDIPKNILLHIIGPSKVNKQSIKGIINSTVSEYVKKEGLKVTKDLRVEQSFEDLEGTFSPGKEFSFDATIHLQEPNRT